MITSSETAFWVHNLLSGFEESQTDYILYETGDTNLTKPVRHWLTFYGTSHQFVWLKYQEEKNVREPMEFRKAHKK